VLVLETVFN